MFHVCLDVASLSDKERINTSQFFVHVHVMINKGQLLRILFTIFSYFIISFSMPRMRIIYNKNAGNI